MPGPRHDSGTPGPEDAPETERDWYTVALGLLGRREHAPKELARKLAARGAAPVDVETVVARLEEAGYLSERRFAEEWVRQHGARRGIERLRHDLEAVSVSSECIEAALEGLSADQAALAEAARAKRFGEAPKDLADRARQWRFLMGRGFSPEIVRRVLGELN